MCSADLREWVKANNLDLSVDGETGHLNPRDAFGSQSDTDHVYSTRVRVHARAISTRTTRTGTRTRLCITRSR